MSQKSAVQQKFDIACGYYKRVEGVIHELSGLVRTVYPEFSTKIAMRQYDYLLQILLLAAGVADDDYKNIENQFVSKIVRYASLVRSYNAYLKRRGMEKYDYDWQSLRDMINTLTLDKKNALIRQLYTNCAESIDELVRFFAPVDAAVKSRDFLEELVSLTDKILYIFAVIDGDSASAACSESEKPLGLMQEIFVSKWTQILHEFD